MTIGRHTPVTYAVSPAYYTVVLWCRLSAVTRQLPRPFCRHITPLYSGAGYRPSHASYLCRFAGILHRCTLVPVIGRHTPVTYAVLPACYNVVLWRRFTVRQKPVTCAVLPAYYTVVTWCRLIGRHMPVVKAVLHILSVRLIADVSAVCSGLW